MEKRKLLLLKYLLNNCSDGYKILDTQKIMTKIKKYKNNYELFESDVYFLKQRKYIDLKYVDENNVCLAIMDNSHILQENLKMENGTKKEMRFMLILSMLLCGVMAFVGSFLATLLLG